MPEGKPYIDEITEAYVQYSFSGKAVDESKTSVTGSDAGSSDPIVAGAWQSLRRLFWKEWMRKLMHLPSKRKQDPYALTEKLTDH